MDPKQSSDHGRCPIKTNPSLATGRTREEVCPFQTVLGMAPFPYQGQRAQLGLCATKEPTAVSVTPTDDSPNPHPRGHCSLSHLTGQGGMKSNPSNQPLPGTRSQNPAWLQLRVPPWHPITTEKEAGPLGREERRNRPDLQNLPNGSVFHHVPVLLGKLQVFKRSRLMVGS